MVVAYITRRKLFSIQEKQMATLKSRAKKAAESIPTDAEIESRFESARAEFNRIAAQLSELGSAKAREYTDMASSAAADLKDEVTAVSGDAIDQFLDQLSSLEKDVTSKVRAKPMQALAIAGGIGFLLALLSRR
jgi:ElaB/YqjD/DUF883 family membrane-anchored ribosome-binding protein